MVPAEPYFTVLSCTNPNGVSGRVWPRVENWEKYCRTLQYCYSREPVAASPV